MQSENTSYNEIPQQTREMISIVTDPYHDRNLRVTGFPDGATMTSVVKRLAYQYTVACPFTLTAGQSWDFHIFTTPLHCKLDLYPGRAIGNILTTFNTVNTVNTLNIFYRLYDTAGVVINSSIASLGQDYNGGHGAVSDGSSSRFVSLAYELHNTTAEIYRSGSITSYRLNSIQSRCDYLSKFDTLAAVPITYTSILTLPYTLGEVQMIPNSRTWEAARGVYSVSLPMVSNVYSTAYFQNVLIDTGVPSGGSNNPLLVFNSTSSASSPFPFFSPISTTGTMSSRYIDASQTFTLDMRLVLEIAPTPKSTELAYATTSPSPDLLFLKLYKRMINSIEPGVPVNYNAGGEWFKRIVKIAKENLPTLIHLLPPQYQAAATMALPVVNRIADKVVDKLSKSNNNIKQPKQKQLLVKKNPPTKKIQSLSFKAGTQRFMPASKQRR